VWEHFFEPRSVAVVGASRNEKKLGYLVVEKLVEAHFEGEIYPINPKLAGKTLLGRKPYARLTEVPGKVDLVVVVIPRDFVLPIIEDCGSKGARSVVIISAGFKEVGEEGAHLEDKILKVARKWGISIIGPNCLGIINAHWNLNASFAPSAPSRGNIAFFSQSGALGTAILDRLRKEGVGISKFISLGNKMDIDEVDVLEMLKDDDETRVILGYLESVSRGRDFMHIAKVTAQAKPLIIIKSGRGEKGKKAASSHTGSLAGQDEAYEVAFRQSGVLRARSFGEALGMIKAFSCQPLMQGNRVALLTNAGGSGILATDACEESSLKVASLGDETKKKLQEKLPAHVSLSNPVDILGDAKADRYQLATREILADQGVNGLLVLLAPQAATDPLTVAEVLAREAGTAKPILACFMGYDKVKDAVDLLQSSGIPNYEDPEYAVTALEGMYKYGEWKKRPPGVVKEFGVDDGAVQKILDTSKERGYLEIGGFDALKVIEACGIPVVKSYLARDEEDALKAGELLEAPLVMKVESPQILHKSEVGGVKVGINKEEITSCFRDMLQRVGKTVGKDSIRGILIQPMVGDGKEVLIGISHDDVFGHMVRFGLGGKYVEVYKDTSVRVAPLTSEEAKEMIGETKYISKLLRGARGEATSDIALVEELLLRLSHLTTHFPQIKEVEANPLVVWKEGGVAIDARLRFQQAERSSYGSP